MAYPFALLLDYASQIDITKIGKSYMINCYACRLINCVDFGIDKQTYNSHDPGEASCICYVASRFEE